MYSALGISEKVINLANEAEENIKDIFENIEKIEEYNSIKVLNAFQKNEISEIHFNSTTGYGYGDIGRDTTEKVFADIFKALRAPPEISLSNCSILVSNSSGSIIESSIPGFI